MAIQVRRGLEKDFDPEKALPGEWLLSTDTRYIRMCITPGVVLRMATYEAFEADMAKIQAVLTECKDIQSAITGIQAIVASKAALTVEYANSAAGYAKAAATSEANAKTYAENASAVAGVSIATQDTAGLMKGGENYVDESGALVLTKTTQDTTLPNSHAGGIKLLGMYGASVQDSTTGAQLFDVNDKYDTFSNDNDGWISVSANNTGGTSTLYVGYDVNPSQLLETNTEYAIVIEIKEWSGTGRVLTVTGTSDSTKGQFGTGDSSTVTANGTYVIKRTTRESFADCITMLRTVLEVGAGNTLSLKMRLSVLADTSVTADTFVYEKFTGNAPSPSVDYPQEINKSVVSEIWGHGEQWFNDFWESGSINSVGKNTTSDTSIRQDGYTQIEPNTIYTVSMDSKFKLWFNWYDADKNYLGRENYTTSNVTVTTPSDAHWVRFRSDNFTDTSVKLMLNKGAEALPYEPYQSFSHILSQPIELNGINGVADDLVSGTKRFAEVVFDGSDDEGWVSSYSGENAFFEIPLSKKRSKGLCSHYTHVTITSTTTNVGYNLTDTNNLRVRPQNVIDLNTATWRTLLAENPITVLYELAEPITEELPTVDKIALNSLKSFDGTTYVYCDCGEVQPTWELEYGTSRVGALALENHCRENVHEIRLNELTTAMLVMNQE